MAIKNTQPLFTHLVELRKRLLYSVLSVFTIFVCLFYFANEIYQIISVPLIKQMPLGAAMIATDITSPFLTPIKLTFWASLITSMPIILYQIWVFVAPALYKNERNIIIKLLFSSSILFYIGMVFAYFIVFPLVFSFLTHTVPKGVQIFTDITSYLSFVMTMFMVFGIAFEIPIVIMLLCWMELITPNDLRKNRPYVLVGAFVVGMLLTPPDVFSQTLLAVPIYFLFEVGVFFSQFHIGKRHVLCDQDKNDNT